MTTRHLFHWLKYGVLRQPYRLYVREDSGQGPPVVLLHGIAASGRSWQYVERALADKSLRLIILDLLGFGSSPKPKESWVKYDVRDHARSVIATLRDAKAKAPIMLVGHSMGCFVAIEIATMRPDLVKNLILYEPPFYVGLPKTNKYRLRLAAYFSLYRAIIRHQPGVTKRFKRAQSLIAKISGFNLTRASWVPFQRSMQNTILQQTALDDLKVLKLPVQIVYGKYDQLVINDKRKVLVGAETPHISTLEVPALHGISVRASKVLARLIQASLEA